MEKFNSINVSMETTNNLTFYPICDGQGSIPGVGTKCYRLTILITDYLRQTRGNLVFIKQ